MKPSESLRIVDKLKAAFPRQVVGRDTLQVYAEALADLDAVILAKVVASHIGSGQWFPTVADLREGVADRVSGLPPVTAIAAALNNPGLPLHPLVKRALVESIGPTWPYDYKRSERASLVQKNATDHYRALRLIEIRALQTDPELMKKALSGLTDTKKLT